MHMHWYIMQIQPYCILSRIWCEGLLAAALLGKDGGGKSERKGEIPRIQVCNMKHSYLCCLPVSPSYQPSKLIPLELRVLANLSSMRMVYVKSSFVTIGAFLPFIRRTLVPLEFTTVTPLYFSIYLHILQKWIWTAYLQSIISQCMWNLAEKYSKFLLKRFFHHY